MKTCCFKGYKPFYLPFGNNERTPECNRLKAVMRDVAENAVLEGYSRFICGFDRGADFYFAEIMLELKKKYCEIKLESAIAHENQASNWSEKDRERYYNLLSVCDKEMMLQTQYTSDCKIKRNRYMVMKSELLIAVYSGKLSGVMSTVNFAKRLNRRIICINPETLEVSISRSSPQTE